MHGMDCRSENELYVGEMTNWRAEAHAETALGPFRENAIDIRRSV